MRAYASLIAFVIFTAFALGVLSHPMIGRVMEARLRRKAVRLHRQNWTHGQIAHELGREPRELARWLAEADQARAA